MKKPLLAVAVLAASGLFTAASAATVTLVNADFESATGKITTGYATIAGWYNAGSTYTDSGVESTSGKTLVSGTALGAYAGYVMGGEAGAYQIGSGYTLNAGDTITLTWEAAPTSNTALNLTTGNAVSLFAVNSSALAAEGTSPTSLSGYANLISNTAALGGVNNQFRTYTLSYVAVAGDQGKSLGVSFANTGSSSTYSGFDNFAVTVNAVPEPSAYGLAGAGLLVAGALVRRRKHA